MHKAQRCEILRRPVSADLLGDLPVDMHPVLKRVYASRGADARAIDVSLAALIPVSRLEGVAEAADRLALARMKNQRVLVVGDFDADGATASALMMTCLRAFGFAQPDFLVPDREKFGYGLSVELVRKAAEKSPELIVTVDNGISSLAGVAEANERGIDVIVTDHHLPGDELPAAQVIVNPNVPGSNFPSKSLAGVGVAFYVMAGLGQRLAADSVLSAADARRLCAECLDLVALGTVADLVPLDANNRVLVAQGLHRMRTGGARPGIEALFKAAGRNIKDATAADLGFAIAPRLNAAGRLDDMTVGIMCLLEQSADKAMGRATELSRLNDERRELQKKMQLGAEVHLENHIDRVGNADTHALCLFDSDWHPGIVGLVATRIKDQLNRPVIAFAAGAEDGSLKGSGRSVKGVHMRDVLAAIDARNPGLITRFGGHSMAAGLSLRPEALQEFEQAFALEVSRHVDNIDDSGRIWSDGALNPQEFELSFAEMLRAAGPWGQGFPEPTFDGKFRIISQRLVGERHLKLELQPEGASRPISAIAFNKTDLLPAEGDGECVAVYRLDVNEFRRERTAQLVVEHIECV